MRKEDSIDLLDLKENKLNLTKAKVGSSKPSSFQASGTAALLLPRLSDSEFDAELAKSIVFLELSDCSVANTVIECMARATPLFVNRHPAIEELLGEDYPGFYDDMEEVPVLANWMKAVEVIYDHLVRKVDKRVLEMDRFLGSLQSSLTKH
jgi:hypothetical protein